MVGRWQYQTAESIMVPLSPISFLQWIQIKTANMDVRFVSFPSLGSGMKERPMWTDIHENKRTPNFSILLRHGLICKLDHATRCGILFKKVGTPFLMNREKGKLMGLHCLSEIDVWLGFFISMYQKILKVLFSS